MSQSRSSQACYLISNQGKRAGRGLPPPTAPFSPSRPHAKRESSQALSEQDLAVSRSPVRSKSSGRLCTGSPARAATASDNYGVPLSPTRSSPLRSLSKQLTQSECLAARQSTVRRSASTPIMSAAAHELSQQLRSPFGASSSSSPPQSPRMIIEQKAGSTVGLIAAWLPAKEAKEGGLQSKEPQMSPALSCISTLASPRSGSKNSSSQEEMRSIHSPDDSLQELIDEGAGPGENNVIFSRTSSSNSNSHKALYDSHGSAVTIVHDVADSQIDDELVSSKPSSSPYGPFNFRRQRSRPWRLSKDEVNAERAEADQILAAGSDAADSAGVNVLALVRCLLAQECLDEHHSQTVEAARPALAPLQAAVEVLRQAATNAAALEDVQKSMTATMQAFDDAGIGAALRWKMKRPSAGKHDGCQQILPGLWLGSWMALNNDCEELQRRKITHVISVVSTERCCQLPSFIRDHLHVLANDNEDAAQGLSTHFPAVCRFIEAARSEPRGSVYVHCGAGISRSPTVVASYLMWKLGVPAVGALELIKRTRPNIRPNLGFIKQLRRWEEDMLALPK